METRRKRIVGLLALVLVLGAPVLADRAQASEHVEEDEPHLLIELENHQDEAQQATVRIEGPSDWAREVTVGPHDTWEHRHAGPAGDYEVRVEIDETLTETYATLSLDNDGCQGPYRLPFSISESGTVVTHSTECQGDLVRFDQLVREARQARDAETGDPIYIPQPRDASEGQILLAHELGEPDWEEAIELPFRWLPNATFPDAWGEQIQGAEVALNARIAAEASAPAPFVGETASATIENRIRYAGPAWEPLAQTHASVASAETSPLASASQSQWDISYVTEPTLLTCAFRNPFQGGELEPGQTLDDVACPPDPVPAEAAWWTGPLEDHRGFPTLTLYGLDDPQDPHAVVKVRWAHGIAHPVNAETFRIDPADNSHEHRALNLTHIDPQGAPLDELQPVTTTKPSIQTGPLHPIEGPRLVEDDRIPFPLAEAVQAARQDPTLTDVQAVLADDGVLAGAELAPREATDGENVRELVWTMAFSNADDGPVLVECRRPVADAGPTTVSPPSAHCQDPEDDSRPAERLDRLPRLSPEDLATRSVSWDEALDRWSIVDPANASAPATLASYRPLVDDPGTVDPPTGTLTVGTDGGGPNAGPTDDAGAPTTVTLDAEDGRIQAIRTGVREVGGLANPTGSMATIEPGPAPEDGGLVSDTDRLVGATAGLGLLGLLAFAGFALYNRLQEDEVLADDTRQEIRDLVDAQPGIHGKAIARRVDANERTVEHHVDVLLREDVLTVLERGGYNHHFVQGQHAPKEMQALASLQRGKAERVYETVRQDPGVDLTTLADRADISKPYASKLVSQLVDVGLVDKVRDGRRSALYANPVSATER